MPRSVASISPALAMYQGDQREERTGEAAARQRASRQRASFGPGRYPPNARPKWTHQRASQVLPKLIFGKRALQEMRMNTGQIACHETQNTFTLDKWCADHKLGGETKIRARLRRDGDKPITAEQRRRLEIGDDEPVKFRHVELTCGDRVLSEADNWYVPSRLTAEMNQLLETTDIPFGRAVADLKPFRQTFAVEILWRPLDDGWEQRARLADHPKQNLQIPPKLFEHRALLYTPDRKPIAEVDETYSRENLAFAPPR
jgi:chorismate-pyruvate lyase